MNVYGNFQAVNQVYRSDHGSVWSARAAGTEDAPDCCIKLLELNEAMLEAHDSTLAQNLLVSAALQQAMGNKSEFWAPVYGLGSQGTNAFYASRLFPRSVQTLIDDGSVLTAAELKTILLAVVDGLIDLDTAFHRRHGNLKPSNVLLDDESRIRPGGVMLCDPDAGTEEVASLTKAPDLKAVGQILCALVTHRPHTAARWPLPKSEKWGELGSTGRQWQGLCDSLLNTVTRRGTPTLAHVLDQIAAINPTRRRTPRAVFAVLALAAVGAAGYVKREKLPGLYHQASAKVVALINSQKNRPAAGSEPVITPIAPSTLSSAGLHVAPHVAPWVPTTGPVVHLVQSPVPTVVPNTRTAIAENSNATVITPRPVFSPTTPAVSAFTPPPRTAAVVSDPAKPTTAPTVATSTPGDTVALKVVRDTPSPEFHSDAAKAEFNHNRDQFVSSHAGSPPGEMLSQWGEILSKIQGIDADYPALEPSGTAGWPSGLAVVVNARRDAMLVQSIDGAFAKRRVDASDFQGSLQRVRTAANAAVAAHDAMGAGDVASSQKAIAQCNSALSSFPASDADLAELFVPAKKEFGELDDVASCGDRAKLIEIADDESAPLAVRLAAWEQAGNLPMDPWPADFATLAIDEARSRKLTTLLQEAGSVEIVRQVTAIESRRQSRFFSKLKDQPSVTAALKPANDPKFAAMLAQSPIWFRYDAALFILRTTLPVDVTPVQRKNYSELAGQVDAQNVQLVHDVLKAADVKPPPLSQSGPATVKGWQMRSGSTRDRCTYINNRSGDSLEFLRVHVADEPNGIDCYLCTTETPVALMQDLLKGDSVGLATAETLNQPTAPLKPGMRLWSFNDKNASVDLDEDDYRKCFVVSPDEQLPVQMVTPQAAFYLARRVGCRLPTSLEYSAALAQAKNSSDTNMKGFASMGWKLRDHEFAKLLTNPNRDADCWPDDNIFMGNLDPSKLPRQSAAVVWTPAELSSMGGVTASDTVTTPALWPLSTLQSSGGFGFRTVGDGENFAGVFHDLIGNVAEYVMDVPVVLAENVPVGAPLSSSDIVHHVNSWFSPDHLATVSVIGGSALSPPELDPSKPYPLPKDQNQFADVGFRLAFTDPASLPAAQHALIAQASYLTAP